MRLLHAFVVLAAGAIAGPALPAQPANRIMQAVGSSAAQALPNHHPLWASPANSIGLAPANLSLNELTVVLSRSPQQEVAIQQFLADQQNPASPEYHHWLTPAEMGERFGLSDQDIASISGWLQSQGLHVNWVAPSRIFIGFGGTAADIGRAFQTEMHYYSVNGAQRISVNSDPMIPAALVPTIKAIRGLYTIDERPAHHISTAESASPQLTASNGNHFITPNDFDTIYDVPASLTGAGMTIGIVSWSRTNPADFDNFKSKTGATFTDPIEVVPTAYGGVDPGPALTAPPSGSSSTLAGQEEATLDVVRAGSVAPAASLLLVVASPAGSDNGIGADAQYLVNSTPVPAQVMSISFGACESSAGPSGVAFWNTLFQQAAAEGISVFVSSGDSGASGCDVAFSAPPAFPKANSPNYICSSSYATCVGGTQFADTTSPSTYWSSANSTGFLSALGYIPEGGWNEPIDFNVTPNVVQVAGSGGGVSNIIATPSWQTGTGVPAARAGRYTPDVSFSASSHDGYFACMAAISGGGCVTSGGSFSFVIFSGTSAAAPGMAGVAALLDQKLGAPQGNLNPEVYSLAAAVPAAFHDVTVASSGVATCDINTASMCNNSIALLSGSGAQPGFMVGTGYDEATGLGSFDVNVFLNNYNLPKTTPAIAMNLSSSNITTAQPLTVTITVSGRAITTATGTVTLNRGAYTSAALTLVAGSATITIPAGSLAAGTDTLTVSYTPDQPGSKFFNSASASSSVTVTAVPIITPAVVATLSAPNITTAQQLTVTIAVAGGSGNQTPTGTVTLTSTGYSSGPVTLANGSATINVLAGSLPVGVDGLTASYAPDAASSSVYNSAYGASSVTVTAVPKITPTVTVTPTPSALTTTQILNVGIVVGGGTGNQTPAGTVKLTIGSYFVTGILNNGSVLLAVAPGAMPPGNNTLTVAYTPDTTSSSIYNTASGTNTVSVTIVTPSIIVAPSPAGINEAQPLTVTATVSSAGNPIPTGSVTLTSGSYSSGAINLIVGTASIAVPAGALAPGIDTLSASYTPDSASSALYTAATGTATITVTKATPVITWNTPAAVTVGTALSATQLSATASVPGTFIYNPTLGTVMSTVGTTMLSTTFTPTDTTDYNTASATVILNVTAAPMPSLTVSGTAVTISSPGATTGNTSTITITPSNGFTGSVTLTAQITTSPAGAQFPPTLSFGATSPVSIVSATPGTASLTVSTTASKTTQCTAATQIPRGIPWYARGGAVVACLLLFSIAPRGRKWRAMLGMLLLFVALAGAMLACGGGSQLTACNNVVTAGTTAGSYNITVAATSGATTATNTVSLTVM